MRDRLLLIAVLVGSLGAVFGSTALLKRIAEYNAAKGVRKEMLEKEIQNHYERLNPQTRARMLRKLATVGIEVEKPIQIRNLLVLYKKTPATKAAKRTRIADEIKEVYAGLKPHTKKRIGKEITDIIKAKDFKLPE